MPGTGLSSTPTSSERRRLPTHSSTVTMVETNTNTNTSQTTNPPGTVYEVLTIPGDPHSFLTCGEDGCVRWFDLRTKSHCSRYTWLGNTTFVPEGCETRVCREDCKEDVLIRCQRAVTSLSINPVRSPATCHQCPVTRHLLIDRYH